MIAYVIALAIVSLLFFNQMLPFIWMVFGLVEGWAFFYFSNDLTKRWQFLSPKRFIKKLFWVSLAIRLVYMVFSYFF